MTITDPEEVAARFVERNALPQAPGFTQALVEVGWARHRLNGSSVVVRRGKWGMFGRLERGPVVDVRALRDLAFGYEMKRLLVDPAPVVRLVDRFGAASTLVYDPDDEEAWLAPFFEEGWVLTRRPIAHTKTLVVDLAEGADAAVARANESTRRKIRRAREHAELELLEEAFSDVDEAQVEELKALYEASLDDNPSLPARWPFRVALLGRLGERGRLLTARLSGELVAAVMLLVHDGVGSYFAAMSSPRGNEVHAPAALVAAAFEASVAAGCDLLDLVAGWDERYPDRDEDWKGFTEFKERFRPVPVFLPPGLEAIPPPPPDARMLPS